MNIEYYKNFVSIVDIGTISAAAERLLVAQPALSKQLKSLEEYFGTQLVVRLPRRIELTDAGKILYDKVKSICYLEEAAHKEVEAAVLGNRGVLRLGITPCSPDPLTELLLKDFRAQYPDVTYEIFERNTGELINLVEQGLIEIAILRSRHHIPVSLQEVMRFREKIMIYYHKDHPMFADMQSAEDGEAESQDSVSVPIKKLKELPISVSNGLLDTFTQACHNAGFVPNIISVSSSRATSTIWCDDKNTVAVIVAPEPFDEGDYCCRGLKGEELQTGRFVVISQERRISAVANTFVGFCQTHPLPQFVQYLETEDQESV